MVVIKNEHWTEVEHDPTTTLWASHLLLGHIGHQTMNDREQHLYGAHLTQSLEYGIEQLKVRTMPDAGLTGFSFFLESFDEREAIVNSITAALEGVRAVDHLPSDYQLRSFNLSTMANLIAVCKTEPDVTDIRDRHFELDGAAFDDVHAIFQAARDGYVGLDEELLSLGIS
jgi:hypothetical protein